MSSGTIGPLLDADEFFNHQIVDTFATVSQSDYSWTEKVCGMAAARDGSLAIGFGFGKYVNRNVVDAYGGIGLFAATVVPSSAEIVLVESSRSSCDDAVVNLAGRAATVCATTMEAWQPVDADVVIADPARQGLQREGVAQIVATGAPTVVLISCDPVSFARDVALLHDAGYAAGPAHVLDLFPGTHHVEVVARLDRVR